MDGKHPDFKHKKTGFSLWVDGRSKPQWVKAELAALLPGAVPQSLFSWNAMLSAFMKSDQAHKVLKLFREMEAEGVKPDSFTFVAVCSACASLHALEEGKRIHALIIQSGCHSDVFVGSTLVDMYAKCGSIEDARIVFNQMSNRDVVLWTAMLGGYVACDQGKICLELYQQMLEEGLKPSNVTFSVVLNACASSGALERGKHVHAQIIQTGCGSDIRLGNGLVDMYAKCGSIGDAWRVFNFMPDRNAVSWTAIIAGCVKCEQRKQALELYHQMQKEGVKPSTATFVVILTSCANLLALEEGRCIHAHIIQCGCDSDTYVGNCLVDMYAKCGSIDDAWRVFHNLPTLDLYSWSSILSGLVKGNHGREALLLFKQMQAEGVKPDAVTFMMACKACASLGSLEEGKRLHAQVSQSGCESDTLVGTALLDMYAKCGSISDAWKVFRSMLTHDVVSWSVMLAACVKFDQAHEALKLFEQMQAQGVKPDAVTFVAVCNAYANCRMLEEGRRVHVQIIGSGWESDVFVGSTLVDMYAKCGSMDDACQVFNRMPNRNVVSWCAMLAGYVKCKQGQKVLELFAQMQSEGVMPNSVVFIMVLNACASLAAFEQGRRVHAQIIQSVCEYDICVDNSLIDMYAKCGSIDDSWRVFNSMPAHDVVSLNAMLGGLAMHGQGMEALQLFEELYQGGMEMNMVTFVCLLSACSHAGLVDEGLNYFKSMSSVHGIAPTWEHYVCIVDLLARAGKLEEAEDILRKTVYCEPHISENVAVWRSLLGACRNHGNLEMGERIAKRVLELDPHSASGYVLLSNIYGAAGQ